MWGDIELLPLSNGENRSSVAIAVEKLFQKHPPFFWFEMDTTLVDLWNQKISDAYYLTDYITWPHRKSKKIKTCENYRQPREAQSEIFDFQPTQRAFSYQTTIEHPMLPQMFSRQTDRGEGFICCLEIRRFQRRKAQRCVVQSWLLIVFSRFYLKNARRETDDNYPFEVLC